MNTVKLSISSICPKTHNILIHSYLYEKSNLNLLQMTKFMIFVNFFVTFVV
jgi:hypothetical protein